MKFDLTVDWDKWYLKNKPVKFVVLLSAAVLGRPVRFKPDNAHAIVFWALLAFYILALVVPEE